MRFSGLKPSWAVHKKERCGVLSTKMVFRLISQKKLYMPHKPKLEALSESWKLFLLSPTSSVGKWNEILHLHITYLHS